MPLLVIDNAATTSMVDPPMSLSHAPEDADLIRSSRNRLTGPQSCAPSQSPGLTNFERQDGIRSNLVAEAGAFGNHPSTALVRYLPASFTICSDDLFGVSDFCLICAPRMATMSQKSSFPYLTD